LIVWLRRGLGAEFVEGADQFAGDLRGGGLLDDGALHEVNQLAVAQDGDRRGSGRVAFEVAAGAISGFAVLSGEDCDFVIGKVGGAGQGEPYAGRILPAAQPQMELTTNRVVPG